MWDIYDRLRDLSPALSVSHRTLPLMRGRGAFREAVRIARVEPGWDIVHVQYGALVGALGSSSKGGAYIVSLRGSDSYWRFGSARNRAAGLVRVLLSWIACLRSDAVVVMSRSMARRVRRWPGLGKRAVLCIPDPAGEIFWPPPAANLAADLLAESFNVIIASLQHGNPIKRTGIVLEAAELCREAGMLLDLRVLSGLSRNEVRATLDSADCVALASTHEGWPNIVKEGLLLGKPFVATDVGDLLEYAGTGSLNQIVGASPIEFACAWVDQIASRLLGRHDIPPELAPFHPDAVALKHRLLYLAYRMTKA